MGVSAVAVGVAMILPEPGHGPEPAVALAGGVDVAEIERPARSDSTDEERSGELPTGLPTGPPSGPPSGAPRPAIAATPSADRVLPEVELLDSFRTDDPAIELLDAVLHDLASSVEIAPEGVRFDDRDGSTFGRMALESEGLSGHFEIGPDGVRVRMRLDRSGLEPPFGRGELTLVFDVDEGGRARHPRVAVAFLPDARHRAEGVLAEGEHLTTGWLVNYSDDAAHARSQRATRGDGPGGWSHAIDTEDPGRTVPGLSGDAAADAWLARIVGAGAALVPTDAGP